MMNFNECMNFVSSFSKSGKPVTDLSRAEGLMKLIGNPEKRLDFIHVAGTNGKGSTVEYISNALIYSGYKVGQFTSPFVLHYTDRIRINGKEIDEKSFCEICEFVKERIDNQPYSQFEITMAIAMLWFDMEVCDIVVLEAGIGGLLDCTNIIESPVLSVITSVSIDHTAVLGDTVEKIALQKAGIIKENSAVVLSMGNKKSVIDIVKNTAYEKNCDFIMPSYIDFKYLAMESDGNPFIYMKESYKTAMLGFHQPKNAVTAVEVCRYLMKKGFTVPDYAIRKSIETTQVKARVQYIDGEPPVIVDGGHNPDGVNALCDVLNDIRLKGKNIYTVVGMIDTKDYQRSIEKISWQSDRIFATDNFASNAVSVKKLIEVIANYKVKLNKMFCESHVFDFEGCKSLSEAVEKAESLAIENNGIVVICGSLYLASEYLNNCYNCD